MSCEPPMYGRDAAGHSSTIAIHHPADASSAPHGHGELHDAAAQRDRCRDEVHETERGHHEERLQHLGQEPEADERERQHQPPGAAALERADHRVGAAHQEQHEQRVGVVEAEHQRGDGRQREHRTGQQRGPGREPPADREVEDPHRGDALERLRYEDAPRAHAEEPRRQLHHPQRRGRLVDGDEVRRVERTEEERLPALRARLDRGRVVACSPSPTRRGPRRRAPRCPRAAGATTVGPTPGRRAGRAGTRAARRAGRAARRRRDGPRRGVGAGGATGERTASGSTTVLVMRRPCR